MSQTLRTIDRPEIDQMEKFFRRNLINSLSGFKSLCLCGTRNAEGTTNLSVISSVIHVGANPPLMGMLIRPDSVPRHTLSNLESTGFFTLNHVHEAFYTKAHQTSARYPEDVSEFDAAGLTEQYGELHPAPYVAESQVRIGLQFKERHNILNGTIFIVGGIVELQVPETALHEDGYLDPERTGTLTVGGLDGYYKAEGLGRLPYAKP